MRDRRIRHLTVSTDGSSSRRLPWSTSDHVEMEAEVNRFLALCGVSPRPAGRVWLLAAPPGHPNVSSARVEIVSRWEAAGGKVLADAAFVAHVDREVRRLFGTA